MAFINIGQKETFKRLTFLYLPLYFLQSFGFYILFGSIQLKFYKLASDGYILPSLSVHVYIFGKIGLLLLVIASIISILPLLSLVFKNISRPNTKLLLPVIFPEIPIPASYRNIPIIKNVKEAICFWLSYSLSSMHYQRFQYWKY